MNDSPTSTPSGQARDHISREELMAALFAGMVVQQTNMALIFLGKNPHPETGERIQDLDAAQMFIDQLEMLEAKTKGNLNKREETLLKESLMTLHMAFVESVERGSGASPPAKEPASAAPDPQEKKSSRPADASAEDAESRKKFTKKY